MLPKLLIESAIFVVEDEFGNGVKVVFGGILLVGRELVNDFTI